MRAFVFFRLIFVVLGVVGCALLLPLCVSVFLGETQMTLPFLLPLIFSVIFAAFFFFRGRKRSVKFSVRSVYLFVALTWISISLFGSIPLYASGFFDSYSDALFESVSGFSTTGATILKSVENLPKSLNLWRCEMHWLGGMGIIALTVALLPLLGIDGFQLIKAETTGPEKGKITPKMANTAEVLWILYFAFTVVHALILFFLGMNPIDSIAHAFSSVSTGGFSTRDSSIAYYNSPAIEWTCAIFMFLSGVNFSLYFYLLTKKYVDVRRNSELKAYILLVLVSSVIVSILILAPSGDFFSAFRKAFFQVVSVITSTGYSTADYQLWHPAAQFVLFALFFVGGSSGSTAGGFKVVRWCVLFKHAKNEMLRLLHPHGVFSLRLDGRSGRRDLVGNVAAFAFVYAVLVFVTTFLGTLARLDIFSAFATALSMVGNVGLSFGELGPGASFDFLPSFLKLWYCFAMIAGRLELYNMLIFFLREYWRK